MNSSSEPPPFDPARAAESNTAWLIGVMGTFIFVALVATALRLYTRIKVVKSPGWDDWVMLACTVRYRPFRRRPRLPNRTPMARR